MATKDGQLTSRLCQAPNLGPASYGAKTTDALKQSGIEETLTLIIK
jgi:hypothetical protein